MGSTNYETFYSRTQSPLIRAKSLSLIVNNTSSMIKSMTGYGKAILETPQKKITLEVKSLNSKQADLGGGAETQQKRQGQHDKVAENVQMFHRF